MKNGTVSLWIFGLLVLLAIPLVVVAGTVSVPNTFVNGTAADADAVNANFGSVETAVNDNDSRITAVDIDAAAAQSTADAAATDAATAQATADAAQVRVSGTCAAGSSIRVIAATGAVTCETDTNSTYSAGSGLNLLGSTFSVDTALTINGGTIENTPIGQTVASPINASTLTVDGNAGVNGGTLSLDNGTSNLIDFGNTGVAPPADGSAGWKLRLYDGAEASTDYGLGIEGSTLWFASNSLFKFYIEDASPGGTYVNHMTLTETGMDLVGELDVANDITFGPDDTSLTAALASAGGGVREINQTCAMTGCFSGDTAGFPVTIDTAGSYRLTSNLVGDFVNTTAIKVTSSDVGIDLNNFAIIRSGCESSCTAASGVGYGIRVSPLALDGTSVKNGSVVGTGVYGVYVGNNSTVSNVIARWNGYGIRAGEGSTVSGNTVKNNGGYGIYAYDGSTVSGNTAYGNGGAGIRASDGSTVSGNTVKDNDGHGMQVADGSTVSGNTMRSNTGYGLLFSATGSAYSGNVISDNTLGTVWSGVEFGQNVCNGNTTCP